LPFLGGQGLPKGKKTGTTRGVGVERGGKTNDVVAKDKLFNAHWRPQMRNLDTVGSDRGQKRNQKKEKTKDVLLKLQGEGPKGD